MEDWRNEDAGALDYKGQQNRDSNRDLYVDRNMQENYHKRSLTCFVMNWI